MGFEAHPTSRKRRHRPSTHLIYPGASTFGGGRGGQLGNSPFSRLPGWKSWSSNSEMQAGFLLLKLPVATMVNGSVSLAGAERPFRGAGKRREEGRICKSRQDVQRLLKCLASRQLTSRGSHFPKGRSRPPQLKFTKPREWRRQPHSQPKTNSKLA